MKISLLAGGETARIIGIMSGTSHDGVDAALAEIIPGRARPKIRLSGHIHLPYSRKLRAEIHQAFNGDAAYICRLNFRLGDIFAEAALRLMEKTGLKASAVHAIASHGQTIHHIPPKGKQRGSTLQIGEAAVIAERTGVATISDFRTRDMAAMGQGAPLVPLADQMLFSEKGKKRAVLNIGGMANVTILSGDLSEVIAFDTGPGNSLMDEAMKKYSSGEKAFDRGGATARSGKPHRGLLDTLLCHPYVRKRPPKSTGRETFGRELVEEILEMYSLSRANILATLCHFTAITIYRSIAPFAPQELIVTGGGMKNAFLMGLITELFQKKGTTVRPVTDFGIPPEAKEALSFALLGYQTLMKRPGNIPSATGAHHPVILGKITLP